MAGYQHAVPPDLWALMDPKGGIAACREFEAQGPCIPFLSSKVHELRLSGNDPEKLHKIFDFILYSVPQGQGGPIVEKETVYGKICMFLYGQCTVRRLKS